MTESAVSCVRSLEQAEPGSTPQVEGLYSQCLAICLRHDDPVIRAIRVQLFFHALDWFRRARSRTLKALVYPAWSRWRLRRARRLLPELQARTLDSGVDTMFLVENETAAGWGTIRPLVDHSRARGIILVTERAALARSGPRTTGGGRGVYLLGWHSDRPRHRRRSLDRYEALMGSASRVGMKPLIAAMRRIVLALLERAGAIEESLVRCLEGRRDPLRLVLHNDFMPAPFLAADVARRTGVQECALQHGMPVLEYAPTAARRHFVWGPWSKGWFLERGTPASDLEITGCPRFDRLFRRGTRACRAGRPRFLVLSQTHSSVLTPGEHEEIVRVLHDALRRLGGEWDCTVKLHPLESGRLYRRLWPRPIRTRVRLLRGDVSLPDALAWADAVVGTRSTAMLEAMIAGLPVMMIELRGTPAPGYAPANSETVVSNGRELAACLQRLQSSSSFRHGVLQAQIGHLAFMFANQGTATDAVLERLRSGF